MHVCLPRSLPSRYDDGCIALNSLCLVEWQGPPAPAPAQTVHPQKTSIPAELPTGTGAKDPQVPQQPSQSSPASVTSLFLLIHLPSTDSPPPSPAFTPLPSSHPLPTPPNLTHRAALHPPPLQLPHPPTLATDGRRAAECAAPVDYVAADLARGLGASLADLAANFANASIQGRGLVLSARVFLIPSVR